MSEAPLRLWCTEPSLSVSGSGSEMVETNHTLSVFEEEFYKSLMKDSTASCRHLEALVASQACLNLQMIVFIHGNVVVQTQIAKSQLKHR